jgi:sulfatase maturation enzyme AslB (radical SAM superfamily)
MTSGAAKEILTSVNDLLQCPREKVKFYNRRIHCDCLNQLYRHLKETAKRTTSCDKCGKAEDRRKIYECSDCKAVNYCSRKCAKAHYAENKKICEMCQKEMSKEEILELCKMKLGD